MKNPQALILVEVAKAGLNFSGRVYPRDEESVIDIPCASDIDKFISNILGSVTLAHELIKYVLDNTSKEVADGIIKLSNNGAFPLSDGDLARVASAVEKLENGFVAELKKMPQGMYIPHPF